MRILHTSDWHLGASLEGVGRELDHAFFLDWLAHTVEAKDVDVLVIAGDVFDQAHPSAEAQRLYYRFLRAVSGRRLKKIVIVGGNHDSASRLEAPKEILESLDIHVMGGLPHEETAWDRCLCPIPGASGGVDAVVLAVPFVHEYRLGIRGVMGSPAEMSRSFRDAFHGFYKRLVDTAEAKFDGAPTVATAHLTCVGVEKGDCPVDIHQVGTIGGLPPDIFDSRLQYIALGHVHRSYRVAESRAFYSGTPLALSLKEAKTARSVRLVELANEVHGAATVTRLDVPSPRDIVELTGSEKEVLAKLKTLHVAEGKLPTLVYARVLVDHFSALVEDNFRKVAHSLGETGPRLLQVRQELLQPPLDLETLRTPASLKDLSPEEVFRRLCQERQEPADESLLRAFRSLLSEDAELQRAS